MKLDDLRDGNGQAVDRDELGRELGAAIRRLRQVRELSQEALARRLEMSRETVRRIEFGEGTTTATLSRVLEALDYTPADLAQEVAAPRVYLERRLKLFPRRSDGRAAAQGVSPHPRDRFHWPRLVPRSNDPRRVLAQNPP